MGEYKICRDCLSVMGVDGAIGLTCLYGVDHRWVKAKVEDCKYLTRTPTGRVSPRRVKAADLECAGDEDYHGAHHYGDPERRHFTEKWPERKRADEPRKRPH